MTTPTVRDIVNDICRSVFASLVQTDEFKLKLVALEPSAEDGATRFDKTDILSLSVQSTAVDIVKQATVRYDVREYDRDSAESSVKSSTQSNQYGKFLSESGKTFDLETILVDEDDADIMAARWAFLLSMSSTSIDFQTALQGIGLNVGDVVELETDKLYNRFGSSDQIKRAFVVLVSRDISGVRLVINDFGNSFTRCARIAEAGSNDFADSSESERAKHGFITDDEGLISGGSEGINLLW